MKYEDLILHRVSRQLLDAYMSSPTHALLISGSRGSGSGTVARSLVELLVSHPSDIIVVEPDEKNTISIEIVRELYVWTRDKKVSKQVIIIDGADRMSHDAQHALLKLLEEPNNLTYFIMTAHNPLGLLSTIFSRLQHVFLRPLSTVDSLAMIQKFNKNNSNKSKQVEFLSQGFPAEITRLSNDSDYFIAKSNIVAEARKLIGGSLFERLAVISRYSKRNEAQELVATLGYIINFMIQKQPSERLYNLAQNTELAADTLSKNGHVRTQLMRLVINGQ
ncbi:hypothetical protein EOM57_01770 [Candidatus Saccharibacteria bacterium]|nr:hypothetical protein [Candidatus Saccharibacteria bacterium]